MYKLAEKQHVRTRVFLLVREISVYFVKFRGNSVKKKLKAEYTACESQPIVNSADSSYSIVGSAKCAAKYKFYVRASNIFHGLIWSPRQPGGNRLADWG